jgi:hypothetical protein
MKRPVLARFSTPFATRSRPVRDPVREYDRRKKLIFVVHLTGEFRSIPVGGGFMKQVRVVMLSLLMVLLCGPFSPAQQNVATAANATVPPLIPFASVATDNGGSSLSGAVSITFSLYAAQQGGEPLWTETQNNIQLDATGHYSVQLGITRPNGVPTALFTTGEARWLGVQIAEQGEQPRVLLLSVPYALKAGDAATIGGLLPSAFVLAASPNGAASTYVAASSTEQNVSPATAEDVTTTGGTADYLPLFSGADTIVDSVLFQTGTGSTAKVGINTTTPTTTLDVAGAATIAGTLALPATGAATATAGKASQPLTLAASAYNSSTPAAVNQTFGWQAVPVDNDTATPSATLNLLFGEGTTTPSPTGLHIASNGQITFATGQTFPGAGGGITGVTAGMGLTGGGTSGNVTLNVNTTKIPQLSAANTFVGNQTVTGNLTASGEVQGGVVNATTGFDIAGNVFASGSVASFNAFLGFGGNSTMTGTYNTASGFAALRPNTTGYRNTASGAVALASNTTGYENSAGGAYALYTNTTGYQNTASGDSALYSNLTGDYNTASGFQALAYSTGNSNTATGWRALYSNTTGTNNTALGYFANVGSGALTNATAIGANATVTESNALVLGSGANVGIGTTAPQYTLDVHGTGNFTGTVEATSPASAVIGTSTSTIFAAVSGGGPAIGVYGTASSSAGYGVEGVNTSGGGTGVYGSGPNYGVQGTATGAGAVVGVSGSGAVGVQGSGSNYGVLAEGNYGVLAEGTGSSASGVSSYGVYSTTSAGTAATYGVFQGPSTLGASGPWNCSNVTYTNCDVFGSSGVGSLLPQAGVWADTNWNGDANSNGDYIPALLATADASIAGAFLNNSADDPAMFAYNFNPDGAGGTGGDAVRAGGPAGSCALTSGGDAACTGTLKSLVATTSSAGAQRVETYAMQSPENWFEDFGSGALSNGAATIALDPTFSQTVNTGIEYHVFLTPKGDSEGLYVSHETPQGFEVHEQRGGHSSVAFDYRIVAKRVGYEKIRLKNVTERFNRQAAQSKNMRRAPRPAAEPQSVPKMPTPPAQPVGPVTPVAAAKPISRAALQLVPAQPR